MSLGNKDRDVRRRRCGLAVAMSAMGLTLAVVAATQEDLNRPREQMKRLDLLTNGACTAYIAAMKDPQRSAIDRARVEFFQSMMLNGEARDVYKDLVLRAFDPDAEGDWSFLANSAPQDVLLETILSGVQPGGLLEGMQIRDSSMMLVMPTRTVRYYQPQNAEVGVDAWSPWVKQLHRKPDLRLYQEYLESHDSQHCAPLIEYLLLRDPQKAIDILLETYPAEFADPVAVFRDVNSVEERLWLTRKHIVKPWGAAPPDEATLAAFDRLARGPNWWTRLYALSLMNPNRLPPHEIGDRAFHRWFILDSGIIGALSNDERPVVRDWARYYAKKHGLTEQLEQRRAK